MYKISLHKKAVKYYQSLDNNTAKRINKAIDEDNKSIFVEAIGPRGDVYK